MINNMHRDFNIAVLRCKMLHNLLMFTLLTTQSILPSTDLGSKSDRFKWGRGKEGI